MKAQILNQQDVIAQMERFEFFIETANLEKIGKRMLYMQAHDNQDGRYNDYVYLLRVLSLLANVGGCYSHPGVNGTWNTYRELLQVKSLRIYLNSIAI